MQRACWLLIAVCAVTAGLLATGERPVTTQAAYWGANGKVAYAGYVGADNPGLWVLGTTIVDEPVQITHGVDHFPDWTPDGKRIAFVRAGVGIQSANADGTDEIHLAGVNDDGYTYPRWAPDGARIAYVDSFSIVVSKPDGSEKHTVATPVDTTGIAWSPDGTEIAALENDGPDQVALFAIKTDGSGQQRKLSSTAGGSPDWSPNGRFILGAGGVPQGPPTMAHIYLIDAVGDSKPKDLGEGNQPRWSPDGEMIVFSRMEDLAASGPPIYMPDGISIMNADGSNRVELTPGVKNINNFEVDPAWQPIPGVQVEFTQAIQQLQTVAELKADLEDDGAPPVPIVAGKPAAMRVYFPEFDHTAQRTVEVSGIVNGSVPVTLGLGCGLESRRSQEIGCKSVDFYFTPPEGAWSVTMSILDETSAVLQEDEFNFTSVTAKKVLIKAVSVCDSMDASGNWLCQDPSSLMQKVSLLRKILPAGDIRVIVTGDVVRENIDDFSAFPEVIDWWGKVDRDLDALYNDTDRFFAKTGEEVYYFGLVRNHVPGGTLGTAYIDTRGGASKSNDFTFEDYDRAAAIVAHEMGHAMGIDHTDTKQPALAGIGTSNREGCWLGTRTTLPTYPYGDNEIRSGDGLGEIEVGFDVTTGAAVPGDRYYEIMGYCTTAPLRAAADVTQWITPFSTKELLSPNGPLSLGPARPLAEPASTPSDYWLVQGTLDQPNHATLEPLVKVTSDGQPSSGNGAYRIEVRDGSNALLSTTPFTPAHGHGSPGADASYATTISAFSAVVPAPPNATLITIFDPFQTIIAQVHIEGAAPVIDSITLPSSFSGVQPLSWSASDPDSADLTYWVGYSPDNGQTWQHQAISLKQPSLILDFSTLAGSNGQGVFRVIASDGVNSSQATSAPFTVATKPPHADIFGPAVHSFRKGALVWLQGAASDPDDGAIDDAHVTWSSSRDGALGTGPNLPVYDLTVGIHTITLTVRDKDNNTATASTAVTITDGPLVEAGAVADIDCSGSVAAPDALALLLHLADLHPESCQTIGAGEPVAFGDADCDGVIGPGDVVAILALQADVPRGCV